MLVLRCRICILALAVRKLSYSYIDAIAGISHCVQFPTLDGVGSQSHSQAQCFGPDSSKPIPGVTKALSPKTHNSNAAPLRRSKDRGLQGQSRQPGGRGDEQIDPNSNSYWAFALFYMFMHVYTYISTNKYMDGCVYIYIHVSRCLCIHVSVYVSICMHVHMHMHASIYR